MKLQIGIDGKSYEVEVEVLEDDELVREPGYLPPHPPVILAAPVAAGPKPAAGTDGHGDESKVCHSPVAGVVLRVNVQPGQQLQANDLMMVLEAMKMETNVIAPAPGKVKSIQVKPGDPVKVNQILVEFE